jgi:hypothetical protein
LGLFASITAPILYPLAKLMSFTKYNPFYLYLDNTTRANGVMADDYFQWLIANGGLQETLWQQYRWHAFRNTMWNLRELIKPNKGEQTNEKVKKNTLTYNGEGILVSGNKHHDYFAGLKFITEGGHEDRNVNQGPFISYANSIFGTCHFTYSVNGSRYFRYSSCRIVELPFINPFWLTIKIGMNSKRYALTVKLNKIKPIK